MTYKLYCADSMDYLSNIQINSIDLIFADPQYFLSKDDGITCSSGKMVPVSKGSWDKQKSIDDIHKFNRSWIRKCYNLIKDTCFIFISGTFHNIYSIGLALQQENFIVVNNITWQKQNHPPNLACKCFTHSTETILLAVKNKKILF